MSFFRFLFSKPVLFCLGFCAGCMFYRWANYSGNGEVFPLADGDTIVSGVVLENIGFNDRYVVLFRPDGFEQNLYVIPDRHYQAGDQADMQILPVTIAELQKFQLRYYEQVGGY